MFRKYGFRILMVLVVLLASGMVFSQAQPPIAATAKIKTVFIGLPKRGTVFNGTEDPKLLKFTPEQASKLDVVIIKKGDKYFWTSRDNHEVEKIIRGAFITFRRLDRPDYVRIIDPNFKEAVGIVENAAEHFDYVEHVSLHLTGLTYYGSTVKYQPD